MAHDWYETVCSCSDSAKARAAPQQARQALRLLLPSGAFELIVIAVIGPLPKVQMDHGSFYLGPIGPQSSSVQFR